MELAYALVTPYTIRKSRTGAILARMLARTSNQLIAMQMIAPTTEVTEAFAASIRPGDSEDDEFCRSLIRDYIRTSFGPDPETGRRQRALLLVFQGENAHTELSRITGPLRISCQQGDTLRNAFGDLIVSPGGTVLYFEPAVILSDYQGDLHIWLNFLKTQQLVLENTCIHDQTNEPIERTLVIIKPDSWRQRSSRPGAILGLFSRTGLRIIGCKVNYMSVNQALEFYTPVKDSLCLKMSPQIGIAARQVLQKELAIILPEESEKALARCVGIPWALEQFERLIEFMSGRRPANCPDELRDQPGTAASLALVYEGPGAVAKIRDVLGPTDPTKAPDGTVRKEFGASIMLNTAHASDSVDNAVREMAIIKMHQPHLVPIVEYFLQEDKNEKGRQ